MNDGSVTAGPFRKLLAAVAVCAVAVGAAWGTGETEQASGDVVLDFVSWQVDEPGAGDWWSEAIARFESEHPGVTVNFTKIARDSYVDQMTTLFVGGNGPDIVHLASFEYPQFAAEGWLEDLAPWAADAGLDLTGWAGQDKCWWEGEMNCIMLLYFGFTMVYHEGLLADAGIAVPTTWEQFVAAARELTADTDGDGIIDQFGTSHHTVSGNQYLTEMLNYVVDTGAYWTDADGRAAMDTPQMIEALTHWKIVLTENLTPLDVGSGEARQMLAEGKVAMHFDGPWIWGIVRGAAPDVFAQLKFAPVPLNTPVGGSSNVIAMNSGVDDARKQLVWDFISTITSQEFQEKYATVGGQPAPRPNAVPAGIYEAVPHFDLLVEATAAAAAAGVDRLPKGLETVFNEFASIVIEEMQRMVIEDLDPAAVAATLQQRTIDLQNRR